jgi:hypothetical protein
METLKFKAIISGPKEYLPGGVKIEDFEITEEDVLGAIEDEDGSSEEAINYLKEEYCAAWEQRWCKVNLIPLDEFEAIKNSPEASEQEVEDEG